MNCDDAAERVLGAPHSSAPAQSTQHARARRHALVLLAVDVALPLALFYGLRLVGVRQWLALLPAAASPLIRLLVVAAVVRRPDRVSAFTLSLLAVGTAVGLLSADPRLLVVRESWFTAVVGLWILSTSSWGRPFVYEATVRSCRPREPPSGGSTGTSARSSAGSCGR